MSEDTKIEMTEATELSEKDLNKVAGGTDGATTPKVQLSDAHITKFVDIASPKLF
jgi:bacteriocin-like protein